MFLDFELEVLLRNRIVFSLTVLLLFAGHLFAGTTGKLVGRVTEKGTHKPLEGVNVVIVGTSFGAATDANGKFAIYNIPAGIYSVQASMMGYAIVRYRNVRIIMDLKTALTIEMQTQVLNLGKEIIVTAERPLLQPDITATTYQISGARFDQLPIDSFKDIMVLQPGVTADGHIRGGRETEVLYLVDGSPIRESMNGGLGSELPNGSIVEMSVQTGGFNAEYGNAMSGVVNIVTKSGTNHHKLWLRALDDRLGYQQSNKTREYEVYGSGPIKRGKAYYFLSSNLKLSDTRWWQDMVPVFGSPIEKNLNVISKLSYRFTENIRWVNQFLYSRWDWRRYEFRWRYNLRGLPPHKKRSYRFSTEIRHTLSPRTFYTLNLARYDIWRHIGQGDKNNVNPDDAYQYQLPWLYFIVSGNRLWWLDSKEINTVAKADLTSQITPIHQLKTGFEGTYYNLSNDLIKYEPQTTFWGKPLIDRPLMNFSSQYHYEPWRFSWYIQDKIDNDVIAANVGIRYDRLDPRARRPVVEWIPVTKKEFQQKIKRWVPSSIKQQWSPRLGLSFPVGEHGFFLINFGYFFQVPLFDYMYTGLKTNLKKGLRVLYGNPDLKPERTQAFEISYKQTFRNNWLVSVTHFKKDITGLVDTKTFLATDSKSLDDGFTQYVNMAGARSYGIELMVEKKYSHFYSGKLSYSYMIAKGYSGSVDQGLNYLMWGFTIPNKEYYLSWDQRHTVVVDIFLGKPKKYGVDFVWRWHSPRPYTYYPSRTGFLPNKNMQLEPNNARMSDVSYLNVKFLWTHLFGGKYPFTAYLDFRNILNRRNLLWVDSSGRPGGELGDPAAWSMGRRAYLGMKLGIR